MSFSDILLIIISIAGLLHGLLFAVYLLVFKKKRTLTNHLLGLIFIFMAFRIGKSVLLYFGTDLEPLFIFAGLAFLLLIGPLLRWYVIGMTRPNFKIPSSHFLELAPFLLVFVMSFFAPTDLFETNNKQILIVFGGVIIFIYLHFAFYILTSARLLRKARRHSNNELQTKSQKAIFNWLGALVIGFIAIWIVYFLNIIEETVPYIVGPIIYSIVVYFLSYKAYKLKATEIDGDVFKENDNTLLFTQISEIIVNERLYLEPNVSLSSLSKRLGISKQLTSEVINQYAKQNFNDFINYYRIQEAKEMLLAVKSKNYTIASIAFDVGFSSLSSFNSAFKKFEEMTPSSYRKG